jgi:hypothetical protein
MVVFSVNAINIGKRLKDARLRDGPLNWLWKLCINIDHFTEGCPPLEI